MFSLEANKTYKFFVGGTKWRLAAIRYIPGGSAGIHSVNNGQVTIDSSKVYNLAGQKVSDHYKGLVIVNGRKVVVK